MQLTVTTHMSDNSASGGSYTLILRQQQSMMFAFDQFHLVWNVGPLNARQSIIHTRGPESVINK